MGPKHSRNRGTDDMFGSDPVLVTQNKEKVCLDDFDLLSVVGKGSFGKVMQVRKDDGKIYAMKVLRKQAILERNQLVHTRFERWFLEYQEHPFIVTLRYAFQTEDKLYMILDYVNGGELFFHLKREGRFSEDRVRLYLAELVLAIEHLHGHGVVYRDLKPENILVRMDGHIQITDFGLSKRIDEENGEKTYTFCGTPEYLAPEILDGSGHGKAVDWWALGTLGFEMLCGLPPFYAQNVNVMYHKILFEEVDFPEFFSPLTVSFLKGLLAKDPQERLGGRCPDIAHDIRAHPYFSEYSWDDVYHRHVDACFLPPVSGLTDSTQFDTEFTSEIPIDSVVDSHLGKNAEEQKHFEGFTFTREDGMEEYRRRQLRHHSLVSGPRPVAL